MSKYTVGQRVTFKDDVEKYGKIVEVQDRCYHIEHWDSVQGCNVYCWVSERYVHPDD